jgi:hypothetical protein
MRRFHEEHRYHPVGRKTYTKGIGMGMTDGGFGPKSKNYLFSRQSQRSLLPRTPSSLRFVARPRRFACQPFHIKLSAFSVGRITRSNKLSRSGAPPMVLGKMKPETWAGLIASSNSRSGLMMGTSPGLSTPSSVLAFFSLSATGCGQIESRCSPSSHHRPQPIEPARLCSFEQTQLNGNGKFLRLKDK